VGSGINPSIKGSALIIPGVSRIHLTKVGMRVVSAETSTNRDVGEERTGMYPQRVSADTSRVATIG
jgi:hypothetical protein